MEPLSASSKSTPRAKKVPFGPIVVFKDVDDEVIEITNKHDERIQLFRSKLSPILDNEDSFLKKTVVAFQKRNNSALVSALNALVMKFHKCLKVEQKEEQTSILLEPTNTASSSYQADDQSLLDESISRCSSISLLRKNSSKQCSQQMHASGSLYGIRAKTASDDSDDAEGERDASNDSDRRGNRSEEVGFVKNLSSRVSWQDLKDFLNSAGGEVTYAEAHRTRRNEGVVEFARFEDVQNAIDKLDDTQLRGSTINIVDDSNGGGGKARGRSRARSSSRSERSKTRCRQEKQK